MGEGAGEGDIRDSYSGLTLGFKPGNYTGRVFEKISNVEQGMMNFEPRRGSEALAVSVASFLCNGSHRSAFDIRDSIFDIPRD